MTPKFFGVDQHGDQRQPLAKEQSKFRINPNQSYHNSFLMLILHASLSTWVSYWYGQIMVHLTIVWVAHLPSTASYCLIDACGTINNNFAIGQLQRRMQLIDDAA